MSLRDFCVLTQRTRKLTSSNEFLSSRSQLKTTRQQMREMMVSHDLKSVPIDETNAVTLHYPKVRPVIANVHDFLEFTKDLDNQLVDIPLENLSKAILAIVRQRLDDASTTKSTPRVIIKKGGNSNVEKVPVSQQPTLSHFKDSYEAHKALSSGVREIRKHAREVQTQAIESLDEPVVVSMQHAGQVEHYKVERKNKSTTKIGLRELMKELKHCLQQLQNRECISESIRVYMIDKFSDYNSTSALIQMKVLK